jgi:Diguanylate cyclase, GGDEF domain
VLGVFSPLEFRVGHKSMIRTWTLGVLCVLVTSFFVGYTIRVQKNDTLVDARTHMVNSVHYLNLDIERTFYGLDQTFMGIQNYLSAFNRLQTSPDDDIQPVLKNLVSENPFVTSYLILNPEGKTDYWSGLGERPNLRYTDYFSIHKTRNLKQLYVGRPFVSKDNKSNWTFAVSKGQRDGDGKLTSVMVAMIDLSYLKTRYQSLSLQAGASMTISSIDDYAYLHLPNHEDYVGRYIPGITQKIRDTNKTLVVRHRSSDTDQTFLSANRKVGIYPLVVSIKESEKTILAKWQKSARNFLGLGIIISLIVLFMTNQVSRYQQKQQQIKEELRNQASTDSLTGLANRRFVLEQAAHEIKKAKRSGSSIAFIMMDLDHFKEVNDSYGHEIGDMVLKDTSIILKKLCRERQPLWRRGIFTGFAEHRS